ncbi:hypothetical protein CR513_20725, partial [Mucuna pruriens]
MRILQEQTSTTSMLDHYALNDLAFCAWFTCSPNLLLYKVSYISQFTFNLLPVSAFLTTTNFSITSFRTHVLIQYMSHSKQIAKVTASTANHTYTCLPYETQDKIREKTEGFYEKNSLEDGLGPILGEDPIINLATSMNTKVHKNASNLSQQSSSKKHENKLNENSNNKRSFKVYNDDKPLTSPTSLSHIDLTVRGETQDGDDIVKDLVRLRNNIIATREEARKVIAM